MKTVEQEIERNKRMVTQLNSRQQYAALKNSLPSQMMAGNIGNINNVIWPFWFTFNSAPLQPNNGTNATFTVTQEAAFVMMAYTKVVFIRTGTGVIGDPYIYTAINALDPNETNANANDLNMTIRDAQSTRTFFSLPQAVDQIGPAEFATVLPTPQLVLPNSTIECIYTNNHASRVYVPYITCFGYRVRLADAANILSTITG